MSSRGSPDSKDDDINKREIVVRRVITLLFLLDLILSKSLVITFPLLFAFIFPAVNYYKMLTILLKLTDLV